MTIRVPPQSIPVPGPRHVWLKSRLGIGLTVSGYVSDPYRQLSIKTSYFFPVLMTLLTLLEELTNIP